MFSSPACGEGKNRLPSYGLPLRDHNVTASRRTEEEPGMLPCIRYRYS